MVGKVLNVVLCKWALVVWAVDRQRREGAVVNVGDWLVLVWIHLGVVGLLLGVVLKRRVGGGSGSVVAKSVVMNSSSGSWHN